MSTPAAGVDLSQLEQTLVTDPDNPSHHFNLGIHLWKTGEAAGGDESKQFKERAAEHFLASAKLNPSDSAAFRMLGHYYSQVSMDSQRAAKCYQRAVTLNPDDAEAGEGLCDLLDGSGKETLEISVCREASEKSPRAFWAFRRLGYLLVQQNKWTEAVQSLQSAIRGYPTCADLWEALGLAYQRLGMFTAAVKSFGRAIELEDSKVFSLIESGNILLLLSSYRQGVEQFRHALEIAPRNVSAHFGLASCLLAWSRECVNSGEFCWGAALLEEASDIAIAATCITENLSSTWKLHGDIQIAYAKCFPWQDEKNKDNLDEETFIASINHWKKTCLLAATSAKRSYQRSLHLSPWQANIYVDVAISSDLASSLEETSPPDFGIWQLPERLCMGSLMLEGVNNEFWVILGCLSYDSTLKQHALIRGLQLDPSLSVAWAYLGKLYRKLGELLLARQAFDHARSIDPSLALPWAGMSVDSQDGKCSPNEAYESCLRAVQILPLAEFQLGLGSLAAASGHLLSPQVFGGIRQAIQRAPFYPELHNLNGLVCEARSDYQSAVAAYRLARCALLAGQDSKEALKSHLADVSFNLARSLCQAGHALDAAHQCEALQEEGLLDSNGFQIYAVALWQLGKNEQALAIARNLAGKVSSMKHTCAIAALGLICTLVYCISGHDRAASMILKLHKGFFHSARMTSIVATIDALGPMGKLQLFDPNTFHNFTSRETVAELHSIIAAGKMIRHGAVDSLDIYSGVNYLQRALHMYPESSILRSQLSSLLLASGDWIASHKATRCIVIPRGPPVEKCLKSPYEIHGAAGVACYASAAANLKFSFQTCNGQPVNRTQVVYHLQKWLHQEPWNQEAKYLLVLNLLQKGREEKFPHHLCVTLKRLITSALSKEIYVQESELYNYQKFLILLCNSEINLQLGDYRFCIRSATDALGLHPSNSDIFFAHLQLCRVYATLKDLPSLRNEFTTCLQVKTNRQIGWISLKYLESKYKLENSSVAIDTHFQSCITGIGSSSSMWATVYNLVRAQSFIWDQDFLSAEQALAHSCSVGDADSCLLLCHGAVCMELARQQAGSQFLWRAVTSLAKAQEVSSVPLPIVSVLLAQTEASLGSRGKWERHLRLEWLSWPAGTRPAELYFQMHLLLRQAAGLPDRHAMIEPSRSSEKWLLRAIHLNPSCLRYWKVLQKITVS